jgi:hypothetical protein
MENQVCEESPEACDGLQRHVRASVKSHLQFEKPEKKNKNKKGKSQQN